MTRAFRSGDQDFSHLWKTNKPIQQAFVFEIWCRVSEVPKLLLLREGSAFRIRGAQRREKSPEPSSGVNGAKGHGSLLVQPGPAPILPQFPWDDRTLNRVDCVLREVSKALLLGSLGRSLHALARLREKVLE